MRSALNPASQNHEKNMAIELHLDRMPLPKLATEKLELFSKRLQARSAKTYIR